MNLIKSKVSHLKLLEPSISVVFWLLLFLAPLLFGRFEDGIIWKHVFNVWRSLIPYLALYLLNRLLFLPLLFFRKKRWLFFISNMTAIVLMTIGVQLYRTRIIQPRIQQNRPVMTAPGRRPPVLREAPPRPPGNDRRLPLQQPPRQLPPFISFAVVSVLIIGFDTGLTLSVKWMQSEQKRISAEKESVASQLAFLQSQVSPHFFMNTLNNIHSLIDIDTNEAKESIIKLSRLMRHLLYDSQVEQIPLKKEIEFIGNYVELMRLRYSEKVRIDLHTPDQLPEKTLPPLLFTSFLENAFKYGISYQESSFIDIMLSCGPGALSLIIRNSKPQGSKKGSPAGIGIENSRKRLDILYGDSYKLIIDDMKDEYLVSLSIPL